MNRKIVDQMVVSLAREIKDGETVFHGVASPLPMVAILLAQASHAPTATYLNITGGVNARPKQLTASTDGPNLLESSSCIFGLADIFDLSARGCLNLAFLSGVQIDQYGNLNCSVVGDFHTPKVRFPGGAGSAVILPTARRVVIWRTKHNTRSFVEQVDFISAQGNVDAVVTPLCVFRKQGSKLTLDSIHSFSSLEEIRRNTGFTLAEHDVNMTPPPTPGELKLLQEIDPDRIRDVEFA